MILLHRLYKAWKETAPPKPPNHQEKRERRLQEFGKDIRAAIVVFLCMTGVLMAIGLIIEMVVTWE